MVDPTAKSRLLEPISVGGRQLSARLAMAPMTRNRADDNHVPLPMVNEYYTQRASYPGTMLITEATLVSPRAGVYENVPGIWNAEQTKAWKEIVDSVHASGCYIWLQLWGLGRTADPAASAREGCPSLLSSSDVPMSDDAQTPKEATESDIQAFISDYAEAAKRAVFDAGFDGVEIHAANGYLIDQFTQDTCNKRTDSWGGGIEQRARFALEVTRAVTEAVGAQKTGIRLSPWSHFQGMRMADPVPQFKYLTSQLNAFGLAYLHLVEPRIAGATDVESPESLDKFIQQWSKDSPLMLAGGFKADSALRALNEEYPDRSVIIAFGRHFLSTPDLPYRLEKGIPLAQYDRDTFYIPKVEKGLTDFPFSAEWIQETKG